MICARKFTGIIGGKEKDFRPGDTITAADAKELGLSEKPHLAEKEVKRAKPAKTRYTEH